MDFLTVKQKIYKDILILMIKILLEEKQNDRIKEKETVTIWIGFERKER